MRLELPGRRPRGRPEREFMDVVKEDTKLIGVREEDAEDNIIWGNSVGRASLPVTVKLAV